MLILSDISVVSTFSTFLFQFYVNHLDLFQSAYFVHPAWQQILIERAEVNKEVLRRKVYSSQIINILLLAAVFTFSECDRCYRAIEMQNKQLSNYHFHFIPAGKHIKTNSETVNNTKSIFCMFSSVSGYVYERLAVILTVILHWLSRRKLK